MEDQSIKSAVINEILRIACFIVYYIVLIAIGAAILAGAFWGAYHLVMDILPAVHSIRVIILLIMVAIGLCLLAIMLGIYLVKPLFSFYKNRNKTRVEVTAAECPELFAMVYELAEKIKCPKPKHIYLSPDVNACVFYDTSFWSIFFPVQKNLEIGLGLFDGTNVDELKSIIAHEFGHFSQNSMKVGSTVYVTNVVLHNLLYTDDFWDRFLDEWCMSDTGLIRSFGVMTRGLTNGIKWVTFHVYKFVQKGYLKLSRYMEYDADNIACQCVGADTFVSALCKIEVLARKDDVYRQMLQSLINEKELVVNYFAGRTVLYGVLPFKEMPALKHNEPLMNPVQMHQASSGIKIEDVWSSHPSLEDRIANARQTVVHTENVINTDPAWMLIPQTIAEKVSNHITSIIKEGINEAMDSISDGQFEEWTRKVIKENFIDERLRPFFDWQTIAEFNLEAQVDTPKESPFTEENAQQIAEFVVAVNDWQVFNQVKNKEVDVRELQYNGVVYKRKNLPLEEFKIRLDILRDKVIQIYTDIYAYVRSKCDEEEEQKITNAFAGLFYAQRIQQESLPRLFEHRAKLFQELNRATRRDKGEYDQLCSEVMDYEQHLKKVISDLDLDRIAIALSANDFIDYLKEYLKEQHNSRYQVNATAINDMFTITEGLASLQGEVQSVAKRTICDITLTTVYCMELSCAPVAM